jgi:hypothetical protein
VSVIPKEFGGTDTGDDNFVLDCNRKNYRELINNNTITIFDLKAYLFTRQLNLLLKLKSVEEVMNRSNKFMIEFGKQIEQNRKSQSEAKESNLTFRLSWSYSISIRIIKETDKIIREVKGAEFLTYEIKRAELLIFARRQLDRLGSLYGFFPTLKSCETLAVCKKNLFDENDIPSSYTDDEDYLSQTTRSTGASPLALPRSISNAELLSASKTYASFDNLYLVRTKVSR